MIYKNILELIGRTPIVRLQKIEKKFALTSKLYAKLEFFNPGGSVKDRIAKDIIQEAREKGRIKKDTLIIEPTSGNTGIGLALVCAFYDYPLLLTMPETMSIERQLIFKAFGAELILTSKNLGMQGAVEEALKLHHKNKNSFMPSQFTNPVNRKSHYDNTGAEIFEAIKDLDYFICGVGTGGTISGAGQFLKERRSNLKVIAVEPSGSPLLSKGEVGLHNLQGLGANFLPEILDKNVIDEIIAVKEEEAYYMGRLLATLEGVFAGISSGAILQAAIKIAKQNENKKIVLMIPDSGYKYLSTPMYLERIDK